MQIAVFRAKLSPRPYLSRDENKHATLANANKHAALASALRFIL